MRAVPPEGVFVTGTGTEVGKTFVSAALACALVRRGVDVGVMKPVASGCRRNGAELVCEDAVRLTAASGADDPLKLVCPLRFETPLAPSVAGRLAGRRGGRDRVMSAYRTLSKRHRFLVVEGVGGLAVPLWGRSRVSDLAARMGLPLLVVADDRLGVLNHTLLTLEHAAARGLKVVGVILNSTKKKADLSRHTNASELLRQGAPVLGRLGYCRTFSAAVREVDKLIGDGLPWPG